MTKKRAFLLPTKDGTPYALSLRGNWPVSIKAFIRFSKDRGELRFMVMPMRSISMFGRHPFGMMLNAVEMEGVLELGATQFDLLRH